MAKKRHNLLSSRMDWHWHMSEIKDALFMEPIWGKKNSIEWCEAGFDEPNGTATEVPNG